MKTGEKLIRTDQSGMKISTGRKMSTTLLVVLFIMRGLVPSNLKVLAKFGLCSNYSQKLDECSLARTRKIFASAHMLGFSVKIPCRVA